MSDEKRDTPTSSLTQAGDIVDTFWDIKPIEFPRLDGDEETSTLLALIKPTNPLLSRLLTMQALMTSRPTWWHNQSSRNAR